ncbi:MAG TPA: hypothetical protein VN025_06795 [Candidatus Dormibacteraeota bacterium]|jgi:hypothetical protein|nr:hypothetical protein [Candidatus Dormibacteraeota bacterium]
MNAAEPRYVGQARAATLLGMTEKDLCRISKEAGFGHKEFVGMHEEYFFTFDELRLICQLTTQTVN